MADSPRIAEEVGGGVPLPDAPFRSLGEMIAARAAEDPQRTAVRSRSASGKWIDLRWGQLDERRRSLAAGLASLGVKRGDTIAVLSNNSPEMLVAELAILSLGAVSAPLFPEYTADVLLHCLADSGARICFAGSAAQQHRLAAARGLEKVVVLDDQPLPDDPRALPLKALLDGDTDRGSAAHHVPVESEDVAFLLYTSGTTGKPKGVELTHGNAISQQAAVSGKWGFSEKDVFLAHLPWHHVFGGVFERFTALWHRALLVIDDSRGRDLNRMISNWAEIKPTVYFAVPRVYGALAARSQRDPKARAAVLHPQLRFIFSAAAPLPEACFRFYEEGGATVLEGWGLTETSPVVTLTLPDRPRAPGVVGWPLPGTKVKLAPVADAPEGRGEILVRGPQVMRGYRGRPSETAHALEGGWFHTGDLGEWTEHGLQLHGRADGVFKLENGDKISAGDVEARILAATPLLEQAVAVGNGQPFVSALVWIAPGPAKRWLLDRDLEAPSSLAELGRVPELRRAIVEALQSANLVAGAPIERVRRVVLVSETPSVGTGEMTPSLMMVRAVSEQRHADLIAAMREGAARPDLLEIERRPWAP
jgi:long-subunit acyl-CoA synthetase (AMP-forming)